MLKNNYVQQKGVIISILHQFQCLCWWFVFCFNKQFCENKLVKLFLLFVIFNYCIKRIVPFLFLNVRQEYNVLLIFFHSNLCTAYTLISKIEIFQAFYNYCIVNIIFITLETTNLCQQWGAIARDSTQSLVVSQRTCL